MIFFETKCVCCLDVGFLHESFLRKHLIMPCKPYLTISMLYFSMILRFTQAVPRPLPSPNTKFVRTSCNLGFEPRSSALYEFISNAMATTNEDLVEIFNHMVPTIGCESQFTTTIAPYELIYIGQAFCYGDSGRRSTMSTSSQCRECIAHVASQLLFRCPYYLMAAMEVVDCSVSYIISYNSIPPPADFCPTIIQQ